MAIIKTKKGEEIIVDDSDYEWLSKFKWCIGDRYAMRTSYANGDKVTILMHREIMNTPKGYNTDHINGNKLDNRRCNLRICTHAENMKNRRTRLNVTTGVQGIHKREANKKKPFVACIQVNRRQIYLGYFATIKEAQQAYIAASIEHFGAFSPYATLRQEE